jgi:midasin
MHGQMDSSDLVGQFTCDKGGFRWQDSALVKGMVKGHWVVLENANQCPAAVLDRLDALLERGGVLRVPERGAGDFVRADAKFRVILTSSHQRLPIGFIGRPRTL